MTIWTLKICWPRSVIKFNLRSMFPLSTLFSGHYLPFPIQWLYSVSVACTHFGIDSMYHGTICTTCLVRWVNSISATWSHFYTFLLALSTCCLLSCDWIQSVPVVLIWYEIYMGTTRCSAMVIKCNRRYILILHDSMGTTCHFQPSDWIQSVIDLKHHFVTSMIFTDRRLI